MDNNFVLGYIPREENPIELDQYIPAVVRRLYNRISSKSFTSLILCGFSVNMKWLYRVLSQQGYSPVLCDWRKDFISYDCGGKNLISIENVDEYEGALIVVCPNEIHELKSCVEYLMADKFKKIPVIYDRQEIYNPYEQQQPYKSIVEKAKKRAVSMLNDNQLFDLIQYIDLTKNLKGDVVEFGSLYGGSGSIIAEAVNHFGIKPVWLFDSFSGIPKSSYGLDDCWEGSFSDNSYKEVENAFKDMKNVKVVKGNILETHLEVENPISFGYIASDTLEGGEVLLNFIWPKLEIGGIIAICDYGSFPNAIPLTVYTDKFLKDKANAFVFYPYQCGIFIMKKY